MDFDLSANILFCKSNGDCNKWDNDWIWVKDLKTQTLEDLRIDCQNIDCYNFDYINIDLLLQLREWNWRVESRNLMPQFSDTGIGLASWYPNVFHVL